MALWLILLTAKAIDNVLGFTHDVMDIRRSLYERKITPRMWYYQGFYDWTKQGGHGVYIRYDNGKTRLVRTFPNSQYARNYLSHKAQKYVSNSESNEQLYTESPHYEYKPYQVYTGDRSCSIDKEETC